MCVVGLYAGCFDTDYIYCLVPVEVLLISTYKMVHLVCKLLIYIKADYTTGASVYHKVR